MRNSTVAPALNDLYYIEDYLRIRVRETRNERAARAFTIDELADESQLYAVRAKIIEMEGKSYGAKPKLP